MEDIAKKNLNIETLETKNNFFDFSNQPVWLIKKSLQEALLIGFELRKAEQKNN